MLERRRIQDLIIVSVIVTGLFSAALLAGNAKYYSDSIALVEFLEVEIVDIRASNIDPTNYSVNPGLSIVLNFKDPVDVNGDAHLTLIRILATLNQQSIIYASLTREFRFDEEALYAGYDKNHIIASDITVDKDKDILLGAYNSGNWNWSLTVRYTYSVLSSSSQFRRTIIFSYEGVTLF